MTNWLASKRPTIEECGANWSYEVGHCRHLSRYTQLPTDDALYYEGKSISKLQMDIELKQIRVLI
jgi:hypothetical protein